MISSVSNVNFRGDAAPVNAQDLINSPGKFTTQAPKADAPADSFEKEGAPAEKKKSKTSAICTFFIDCKNQFESLRRPRIFGKKLAKCVVFSDKYFYGKSFFKP